MATSPKRPSCEEMPAPKLSSPVGTSVTSTVSTERSGALPSLVRISTLSKKPRFRMRCRERRIRAELKASPSTSRNSRRITSSTVRTLPTMSIRSM